MLEEKEGASSAQEQEEVAWPLVLVLVVPLLEPELELQSHG